MSLLPNFRNATVTEGEKGTYSEDLCIQHLLSEAELRTKLEREQAALEEAQALKAQKGQQPAAQIEAQGVPNDER